MAQVDGVGLRRVVFQIDGWQSALAVREDLRSILEIVLWRLIDNQVEVKMTYLIRGNLAHVGRQVERPATATVALWLTRANGEIPVVLDARQRIQVTPMDVPDQYFQAPHARTPFANNSWACART